MARGLDPRPFMDMADVFSQRLGRNTIGNWMTGVLKKRYGMDQMGSVVNLRVFVPQVNAHHRAIAAWRDLTNTGLTR